MPIFTNGNRKILFIHIPKSAGSSIERIGRDKGWEESFSVRGKSLTEAAYYKATPQHFHADILRQIFDFKEFDSVFTIVRNPYDRLKSEYYWQRDQSMTNLQVDDWVSNIFQRYSENQFICDNHIRPQVEFLPDYEHLKILKLEENGVEKAKEIFVHLSEDLRKGKIGAKLRKTHFGFEKREKQSVKHPKIEAMFAKNYGKIVEFYKADYDKLSYDT
jgi:hypothetical protein